MSDFFQKIGTKNDCKWLSLMDWLFNDTKFAKWSSNQVGLLTKQIKQIEAINQVGITDSKNGKGFPTRLPSKTKIVISGGQGSKDFISHIRNIIAHGNADFKTNKNGNFVLLKDYYTTDSKWHKKGEFSAYYFFPEKTLFEIQSLYGRIKKYFDC